MDCQDMIIESFGRENNPSDTLVTKILLGVFGNVPAFDRFFRKGFAVHSFGRKSLRVIAKFYEENRAGIDKIEICTFDYATGSSTHRKYPKAKLIDMIKNIEGLNKTVSAQKEQTIQGV